MCVCVCIRACVCECVCKKLDGKYTRMQRAILNKS